MPDSAQPIVIAHHIMWTLYGCWLPNDPRGSTSQQIRAEILRELGDLHFGRKPLQPVGAEIRKFYAEAKDSLKHPLLLFKPNEFAVVASAIGAAVAEYQYTCYACAIMPDHVHLVIRKHKHSAEEMIENVQLLSRERLVEQGLRQHNHPVWTHGGWKVFLDHPDDVRRTIRYVENNPVKQRLPKQNWTFVKAYDGWPLHPGHSPNSPYAKALRAAGRYP